MDEARAKAVSRILSQCEFVFEHLDAVDKRVVKHGQSLWSDTEDSQEFRDGIALRLGNAIDTMSDFPEEVDLEGRIAALGQKWAAIKKFRNVIAHSYHKLDADTFRKVIEDNEFAVLRVVVVDIDDQYRSESANLLQGLSLPVPTRPTPSGRNAHPCLAPLPNGEYCQNVTTGTRCHLHS